MPQQALCRRVPHKTQAKNGALVDEPCFWVLPDGLAMLFCAEHIAYMLLSVQGRRERGAILLHRRTGGSVHDPAPFPNN